jgi:hypothetical protein
MSGAVIVDAIKVYILISLSLFCGHMGICMESLARSAFEDVDGKRMVCTQTKPPRSKLSLSALTESVAVKPVA